MSQKFKTLKEKTFTWMGVPVIWQTTAYHVNLTFFFLCLPSTCTRLLKQMKTLKNLFLTSGKSRDIHMALLC